MTLIPSYRSFCCHVAMAVMLIFMCLSTGCSTGIESTKKIRLSKGDLKALTPTEEQKFIASIKGSPLSDWNPGKRFLASSDRSILIFEPSGLGNPQFPNDIKGHTLKFEYTEVRPTPDLKEECVIVFSDNGNLLRYPTGKTPGNALKEIDSSKLPLLTDLDLIEEWKDRISGMSLWTRSSLWYDIDGNRTDGVKFADVTVTDVFPSTGDFPMNVAIRTSDGKSAYLHMNYTSDMADSRSFPALFILSNPRSRYPDISDENWALIQHGRIGLGMTKEECRLSLGTPDDLDTGRNAAMTMDIWKYSDGTYLIFTDGLLTRYRQ